MTDRPERIIDAHVHLWDPARTDWYPYLSGGRELGLGDTSGMARRFDVADYEAESTGWNVEALVNVAAATGMHSVAETLALDVRAETEGGPAVIVGGLPPTETVADAIESIEVQQGGSRFRGVRSMGPIERGLPPSEVLAALAERDLLYEVMAHPDGLIAAAAAVAAHDTLTVVVEHAGWPRCDTDEEFALWETGLRSLADVGDRVVCKLSGLAMPMGSMDADVFAPWIERAIEIFGPGRCMFASNFPVDGIHGSLDRLWSIYAGLTAGMDPADRDAMFAGTATAVYRI